jgi:hypothetical protein
MMALELLRGYQKSGNSALGTYRAKDEPFDVNAQMQYWLNRSKIFSGYFPEVIRYLLNYPKAESADIDSLLFWEKVRFGLKPTLRLNHAITFRPVASAGAVSVVAVKQLYASHYFQLTLDLTACIKDTGVPRENGFYLISLRGSSQHGLTGTTGAFLRKVIVGRTRDAQERVLTEIKPSWKSSRTSITAKHQSASLPKLAGGMLSFVIRHS